MGCDALIVAERLQRLCQKMRGGWHPGQPHTCVNTAKTAAAITLLVLGVLLRLLWLLLLLLLLRLLQHPGDPFFNFKMCQLLCSTWQEVTVAAVLFVVSISITSCCINSGGSSTQAQ